MRAGGGPARPFVTGETIVVCNVPVRPPSRMPAAHGGRHGGGAHFGGDEGPAERERPPGALPQEHFTRVPPWRKMGLQVAIDPPREPRTKAARAPPGETSAVLFSKRARRLPQEARGPKTDHGQQGPGASLGPGIASDGLGDARHRAHTAHEPYEPAQQVVAPRPVQLAHGAQGLRGIIAPEETALPCEQSPSSIGGPFSAFRRLGKGAAGSRDLESGADTVSGAEASGAETVASPAKRSTDGWVCLSLRLVSVCLRHSWRTRSRSSRSSTT